MKRRAPVSNRSVLDLANELACIDRQVVAYRTWLLRRLSERIGRSRGGAGSATAPASCEKDEEDLDSPQMWANGRRLYGIATATPAAREPNASRGRSKKMKSKLGKMNVRMIEDRATASFEDSEYDAAEKSAFLDVLASLKRLQAIDAEAHPQIY